MGRVAKGGCVPAAPLFASLGNVLRILTGPIARRAITADPEAHGPQITFADTAADLLGALPNHLRKMGGGRGETGLAVIVVVHFLVPGIDGAAGTAVPAPGEVFANVTAAFVVTDPAFVRPLLRRRRKLGRPGKGGRAMLAAIAVMQAEDGLPLRRRGAFRRCPGDLHEER